jgi:hypothetical protein
MQACTTSWPKRANGPTVLQTTWAPVKSFVSEAVSCSTSAIS